MSEASGRRCTSSWRGLEDLERSMLRRRRDLDDSLSKVFFPECNTVREDDGGLYPYQRVAVELLRGGQALNLLVASPTGSGKTRVIEEAVAVARERGQRIYVCEPLIALVEQIYQRIPGEDVRMLTGPSKKGSEEADVTICTYEVLATKAGAQPECLDGCPTIVIDEFHFLGSERGHVLQEILSHCQDGRAVVALSGTMPNVAELAALLSRVNGFPTYVLGAARRPIDLSFYCYSSESRVSKRLLPAPRPPPFDAQRIGGVRNRQELLSFLRYLSKWDCNPSLLVAFSCRKLDEMANWASSIGSLDRSQRLLVEVGFSRVEKTVPEEDRCLFSVYKQWAQAGVAVHHSHAPVQYLELVSWLAERKALTFIFSSSTLSAGINLPVRTVCLLSARVPRKADGGGVVFEDIDPMLFHQLVGRAGRPGLETRGNCLVLVRRDEDYSSAQALMMSSVPAVQPTTIFETGDVLRACRDHRDLAAEMQATADPSQHVLSLSLSLARRLKEEAFKEAEWGQEACEALGRQAEAVAKLLGAPPALLTLCEVPNPRRLVLGLGEDGSFCCFEASSAGEDALYERTIPLTCAKKTRQIPFQELQNAIVVKRAIEEILGSEEKLKHQCPQERKVLSRICFNFAEAELMLAASPLREELKRQHASLEQQGFLLRDLYGVSLTKLGLAACQIRTLPDPTSAVTLLLKLGPLPPMHYLALMSQALQDGPRSEDALSTLSQAEAGDDGLAERLRRAWGVLSELQHVLPPEELGSPLNTLATLCWAEGATLDQIRSFVPVGLFCRHVTRVHDLCCEAISALSSLDVSPDAFEEAAELIFRGMPFQRRGAWKTVIEDP